MNLGPVLFEYAGNPIHIFLFSSGIELPDTRQNVTRFIAFGECSEECLSNLVHQLAPRPGAVAEVREHHLNRDMIVEQFEPGHFFEFLTDGHFADRMWSEYHYDLQDVELL